MAFLKKPVADMGYEPELDVLLSKILFGRCPTCKSIDISIKHWPHVELHARVIKCYCQKCGYARQGMVAEECFKGYGA